MKYSFFALAVICCVVIAQPVKAQELNNHRVSFHTSFQVALLRGGQGAAFQAQSLNGIRYKSWFAGLVTGIDLYHFRTVPLLFETDKYFGKKQHVFLFGNAGISYVWARNKDYLYGNSNNSFNHGFTYEAGGGYERKLKHIGHLRMSVGYSQVNIRETMNQGVFAVPFLNIGVMQTASSQKYYYTWNRLAIHLGIMF